MIHFSEPFADNKEDSLSKLRYFIDSLQICFRENYNPENELCIYEYLSLWKGRLSFRIYIPNERERYGIKIDMLCESSTGYLFGFIIYTGGDTNYVAPDNIVLTKPFDSFGNPSKVVLSLLAPYLNKGYSMTLDNFYTAPELAKVLYINKTDVYGTLRRKVELPHDFWLWKTQKTDPPNKMFAENIMVLRWIDPTEKKVEKVVSMLSTIHTGELKFVKKTFFYERGYKKPRCNCGL